MKFKLILILLLFITFQAFGQYVFDSKCLLTLQRTKPKAENIGEISNIFFSSENHNYYLDVSKGFYKLFDNTKKEILKFSESTINGKPTFELHGKQLMRFDYSEFEIKRISVEKLSENKYLVKSYPRLRAKRSNLEVLFTIKKSTYQMMEIRFMDLSPSIHQKFYEALIKKLDSPNYQWEKAEVDYRNGYQFIYEISGCETSNLCFRFE